MAKMTKIVTAGLVLSLFVVVGCIHKVDLKVTNATKDTLPVVVSGRGIGTQGFGMIGGNLGEKRIELKFKYKDLPSDVTVRIGEHEQGFTVTRYGPRKFWVDLTVFNAIRLRGEGPVTDEKTTDIEVPQGEPEEVIE